MQTLEQQVKNELGLPNYNKQTFNIEFADHVESDGTCWICLNTGNPQHDVATLERIKQHWADQTQSVVRIEAIMDVNDIWGHTEYCGSELILKLKA